MVDIEGWDGMTEEELVALADSLVPASSGFASSG